VRIVLVTHHYAPEVGAPQRRWSALVPRLIAAGHEVTVLAPSPHYPEGRAPALDRHEAPGAIAVGDHGETIYRLRFRDHGADLLSRTVDQGVTAGHAVLRGVRHLSRGGRRPDVVIATVPGIPSIGAGVALAHGLHVPLVVEMRDAWPDLIEPSGMLTGSGTRRTGWRGAVTAQVHRAMTFAQRDAAAIVTTTETFADVLRERGMRRVVVVRNGANLAEVPLLPRRAPGDPTLRIAYLGTVGRSQGLGVAVRAVAELHDRGVPVRLRVVGSGADLPAVRSLAAERDAPVDVLDPVPRAEVIDHYRWADSLLVSLRGWGPFEWTVPSKLYEVLATGRHVTGVLAGEAAEILRGTSAGDVVPPEDVPALADLWGGLARDRRGLEVDGGGREWALQHANFDLLAERYLTLLDEVVG
jgi:glycosyltransferase involved in cell wall biosynthesis